MAKQLTLLVPPDHRASLPLLTLNFCTATGGIPADAAAVERVASGEAPSLLFAASVDGGAPSQPPADGSVAVSLALSAAATPDVSHRLLGSSPLQRAQVLQWLFSLHSPASPLSSPDLPFLALLNSLLALRPALVSLAGDITLADIAVYCAILEQVACLPLFDRIQMPHLMRWVDLVQTLTFARDVVEVISVKPPAFEPPQLAK